jgi:hypothetical protein
LTGGRRGGKLCPMKRTLLLLSLLCLAFPVRAQGPDDDDDGPEEREVEVRVKRGGPGGGPGRGGPGRDGPRRGDEEGGGGGEGGPFGGGRGRGMKHIFFSNEHHAGGIPEDPTVKDAYAKLKAAQEKVEKLKPRIRDAKEADKPALRKDVKAAVGEVFDAKLGVELAMWERMNKHLSQKKAKLDKRKEAREKLVQEKADQLMGDTPSWDD